MLEGGELGGCQCSVTPPHRVPNSFGRLQIPLFLSMPPPLHQSSEFPFEPQTFLFGALPTPPFFLGGELNDPLLGAKYPLKSQPPFWVLKPFFLCLNSPIWGVQTPHQGSNPTFWDSPPPPQKKTLKTSFLGLKDFFLGLNTSYHGSKPPSWGSKPPITNQNLLFGAEHSPFGAQPFPYELCPTHFGAKHPLFWAHVLPRPSHPPLLGLKPVFWGCRTLVLGPNMSSLGPNAPPIMAQNPLFASFFPIPTQPSPLGLKTPFLGLIPPTHLPSQVSKSPFGSQTFLLGDESLLLGLIPPHQSSNPPTGAKNLTFGGG